MTDVVCFGELMLRLTTPLHHRLMDAPFLDRCFGGAEANVAVQLADLGTRVAFVTRLPENELGDGALEALRARAVCTDYIQRGGSRLGVYFVSPGHGHRQTTVLYDRAGSAICELIPEEFDWHRILAGAKYFHWSGITAALGTAPAKACLLALKAAKELDLTVCFDVNHRAKLWSQEQAAKTLRPLMKYVDVCICGEDEAVSILGAQRGKSREATTESLAKLHGFKCVAMTHRSGEFADTTEIQGTLYADGAHHSSREYKLNIIDRIGTGDAFTGALIHAMVIRRDAQSTIDFATAACVWKHSIPGDWNRATECELLLLAAGPSRSTVQR